MELLGWFLLIGMVAGTIAAVIDSPAVIVVFVVICWVLRNISWVDR